MPRLIALCLLFAGCAATTGNQPTVIIRECSSGLPTAALTLGDPASYLPVSAPTPEDASTFGIAASATACGPRLVPAAGAPSTGCDGLHVESAADYDAEPRIQSVITASSCVQIDLPKGTHPGSVSASCNPNGNNGNSFVAAYGWFAVDTNDMVSMNAKNCAMIMTSIIFRFE